MARYFFHLYNDSDTVDHEGTDLPDVQAAIGIGRQQARVMAAESVRVHGHLMLDHHIRITDELGGAVATVTFADVVTIGTDNRAAC